MTKCLIHVDTYRVANWTKQLVGQKFSDAQRANWKMKKQTELYLF